LFTARPTARPLAGNPLRDVVRSRNPSESTLAHDAVATAVLHKHHSIIRVGAGLIQLVYGSHLRSATERSTNALMFYWSKPGPEHKCSDGLLVKAVPALWLYEL